MKVEIELTENVIEMLERYREKRIKYFENHLKESRNQNLETTYREQMEFYGKMDYKHLVFEYLNHQAYFEDKKTDRHWNVNRLTK